MCVMAVVGAAPCQCFSPGGNQTTSPGRISSIGPPQCCARPEPAVTISVWPRGWVCQAVRAPGSNVTLAPAARAGAFAWNNGSMRTVPVNQSAGPLVDGCEPILLISIVLIPFLQLHSLSAFRQDRRICLFHILRAKTVVQQFTPGGHRPGKPGQDIVQ